MIAQQEEKNRFPLVFVLKVLAFIASLVFVFYLEDLVQRKMVYRVIKGLNTFLIPSIIISILRFLLISIYNARHARRAVRGNFVLGINRLTTVLNVVFMIVGLMVTFNINPLDLLTSLTIVAMAIAVIFRDYITNMLSGLFIMFSDELSVGDRIQIGAHQGRIVDINFASIILQNEEDDMVLVPNNLVFTQALVNLSAHRSNLFTVKFELPLTTATAVRKLEEEILNVFVNHPNLAKENDLKLQVEEIGKDYVRYKMELHAVSSSNKLHKELENEFLKHILLYEHIELRSS